MKCSVYLVCPSVLSCSNLKLHQTLEVKNIFKQENILLQLTFNRGLTLIGFRTTRPCRNHPMCVVSAITNIFAPSRSRFSINSGVYKYPHILEMPLKMKISRELSKMNQFNCSVFGNFSGTLGKKSKKSASVFNLTS